MPPKKKRAVELETRWCSHCGEHVSLKCCSRHIENSWNHAQRRWRDVKNGQPLIPDELPDFGLLSDLKYQRVLGVPRDRTAQLQTASNETSPVEPSHGSGILPSHGLALPEAMANDFAPPPDDYDFGAFDISHDHDPHEQQTDDDVMSEPEAMTRPTPRVIRADFSRLWMSLFAWFYHFRVSRAAFAALLAILAHFTLFLVATANLFSSDGGTYPGDDDVVFPSMHRLDKYTGMSRHNDDDFFRKLVACPKCMSVYEPTNLPRQCTYVRLGTPLRGVCRKPVAWRAVNQ